MEDVTSAVESGPEAGEVVEDLGSLPNPRVVLIGHPMLTTPAMWVDVVRFRKELERLADYMYETMQVCKGVGIAAPQVGFPLRVFVTHDENNERLVICNPRLIESSGETDEDEGCLSVPGLTSKVKRSARVVVAGETLDGMGYTWTADGLAARVFQHEMDHLDGMLFVNRLSLARASLLKKKLKQVKRDCAEAYGCVVELPRENENLPNIPQEVLDSAEPAVLESAASTEGEMHEESRAVSEGGEGRHDSDV